MAQEAQLDISLALDWTPNTNHVGFYVAKALGFYRKFGLNLAIISPHLDSYGTTPASKLSNRTATFALGPSETVISYNLPPFDPQRWKVTAIAALLQCDLSAIATLKKRGISRPRDLDSCIYASYGARFEGRIVQKLIQADGGKGSFVEFTPDKLGIWESLLAGEADATWIFKSCEGIEASLGKIELNEFILGDYGIPYGYSPVVMTLPDTLKCQPDMVRNFLQATKEGFAFAAANIQKAAEIFLEIVNQENASLPKKLDPQLTLHSLKYLAKYFFKESGVWGLMSPQTWIGFVDWLSAQGLLTVLIQSRNPVPGISASLDDLRSGNSGEPVSLSNCNIEDLFTNAYLA